ncbi:MAG: hypothetical protein GX879_01190, partial [Bacteroidales bacterium]|nr:hypothetical protein [Bacteroidales bacterium]
MNLGAIVIAGDGIFNLGENPLYLNKPQSSIFTIALGDTLPSKDVYIKDIQHNKAAFYKNKFPVRIVLAADKCKGETTKIEIHGINGKVYEKQVNIDSDNFITTIDAEIEASPKGLQEFKVVAKNIEGEISLDNNSRIFVVDIIDNRKNILFLSNGVHPDIGAIANALKDQPDYSITTKIISDASLKFENYELIVLHQIPSEKNVAPQLIQYLKQSKTPALYILGEQTALDAFNQIQTGLSISSLKSSYDEASPIINRNFNSFTVDEELKSILSSLPPLVVHFGDYKISAQAKLMMYQRINTVLTDKPLIMFIDESGIRNGIIVGEGIWRWRLHLYNITGTHELFDNLISRSIQYLVQTKIKHSLLVDTKRIYNTNEAVVLTAEFYDEAFDLRNQSELEIIVKDSLNKENKLRFVQKDDYYTLNLGSLSEGKYSYLASLNHDGKPHSAEGEFVVLDVSTEKLITKANHEFLYRLATENSGKMFYPNQLDALADVLEQDENIANRIYSQTKLSQLIELKYLFFIILLFASIEWFFRKFWGSY